LILGLGVDIVEVSRIARAMKKAGFTERILRPEEMREPLTAQYVAGRWAVKEAIAKASDIPLTWQDVAVLNGPNGAPYAIVRGLPEGWLVTISHERGHAVGVAIRQS